MGGAVVDALLDRVICWNAYSDWSLDAPGASE